MPTAGRPPGAAKILAGVGAALALVLVFVLGGQMLTSGKKGSGVSPVISTWPSLTPTTTAAPSTTEPIQLNTAERALTTHAPER